VLLLAASATRGSAQGEPAAGMRVLTAPDGDRFLLLPIAGAPPVVHWVIVTPAGPAEDPDGLEGLAVAVARASLAGTTRVGTRDRATEIEILARIEEGERRRTLLRGAGQAVPEALLDRLRTDVAQANVVADGLAWERALRRLPASPSRLLRMPHATLLQLSTPTESVGRLVALLLARREEPILRGIHDELRGVRAELVAAAAGDAWTALRDEVRSLAYGAHPAGRQSLVDVEPSRPLARTQALEVFARTQRPERTQHVLVGGFDAEAVAEVLVAGFAASVLSAEPFAPAPPPPEPRPRTSRLTTVGAAGIAVACRVPDGADPDAVALASRWLAQGDESFLARWLFARGVRVGALRSSYPYGMPADGALVSIEVGPADRDAADPVRVRRLFDEVDAALAAAAAKAPLPEELALTRAHLGAERAAQVVAPDLLATYVAMRCAQGLPPQRALRALDGVSDEAVAEVLRGLLVPERMVRVTREPKP